MKWKKTATKCGIFLPCYNSEHTIGKVVELAGPAHWELSFRTRALDNQIYMIGCAPMRDESAGYISWGHSIVTDPWGRVIDMLDEKEGVLLTELDLDYEEQVREELPLLKSRRKDMYRLEKLCK